MSQVNLNNFDALNVQAPEEKGGNSGITFKIGGPDQPLILKLLPDPKTGKAYVPMTSYPYQVGPNEKTDSRTRPSLQALGLTEKDPENNKKWEYIKQLSNLKKSGVSKNDPRFKTIQKAMDLYKEKESGYFYYIEPNSETIKCLKAGKMVINALFGREGKENIKAVPSLLKALAAVGKSPYKTDHQDCWLKIWKTGEGLGTEYHVVRLEEYVVKVVDGETYSKKVPVSLKVSDKFLKGLLDLSDFPDPLAFEAKGAFTLAETEEFIATDGVVIPERFMKKRQGGGEADLATDNVYNTVSNDVGSFDDLSEIPF